MATLNWIGKEKVINHHLDVPFRTLKHKYTYKDGKKLTDGTTSDNKIIHGDNLEALKSLLPEYEGKIKCIYIDPPYNTGEESWVYNDNVNHPKINKWLGDIVGKEGDDLTRHDKWLCMIYPRLKILHKLLKSNGVLWVSIDDNEVHMMRAILDEIFGRDKFVSSIVWQKRYSRENRKAIGNVHEYLLVYSKNPNAFKSYRNLVPPNEDQLKVYKNPNNDPKGRWRPIPMTAQAGHATKSQFYSITAPGGAVHEPPAGRCWSVTKGKFEELRNQRKVYFGKNNNSQPNLIRYMSEIEGFVPWSWWPYDEVGHTDSAKKEMFQILGKKNFFDTPKPTELIERVLRISTSQSDIILDSFSGSATTAHAVLRLNKEDEGNRKFIMVEMEDYAEDITAERVKRVIDGYGNENKKVEGTGGDFEYLELGDPLFNEDQYINENQPMEDIRKYVYYSETRTNTGYSDNPRNEYYLGKRSSTAYYFFYTRDSVTTLDLEFASKITIKADQYIVYADKCTLSEEYLNKHNIIFKKIPRDITRI